MNDSALRTREFHLSEGQRIQPVLDSLEPGDTLFISGTHNERLLLTRSGSANGGHITIRNATGQRPRLTGRGLGNGYMIHGRDISYVKIQGLHVTDYVGTGIIVQGSGAHVEIRDNIISNQSYENVYGHGILVDARQWPGPVYQSYHNVVIDGNHLRNIATGKTRAYNEALSVAMGVKRFQITNNVIEHTPYIGIDMIGIEGHYPQCGHVSRNTVRNSGKLTNVSGIYVDGAKDIVIEENVLHDNSGHGISIGCEAPSFTTENIIVRRNVAWNNRRNIAPLCAYHGMVRHVRAVHNTLVSTHGKVVGRKGVGNITLVKGDDVALKNNISVCSPRGVHVETYRQLKSKPKFDGNLYFPSEARFQYGRTKFRNYTKYTEHSGQDRTSLAAEPLFVASGKDWSLMPGSPGIDSGVPLTCTLSAGTGSVVSVLDTRYFHDGYHLTQGDEVQIGDSIARVISVDHLMSELSVDQSIAWQAGDGVSYPFRGLAPDCGAYEHD